MFRVWGLTMLKLVRGIVGSSEVNDVSKWGFPQAATVAISTGGPVCASRLLPRLALANIVATYAAISTVRVKLV